MARRDFPPSIDRRRFLTSAAAVTATGIVGKRRATRTGGRPGWRAYASRTKFEKYSGSNFTQHAGQVHLLIRTHLFQQEFCRTFPAVKVSLSLHKRNPEGYKLAAGPDYSPSSQPQGEINHVTQAHHHCVGPHTCGHRTQYLNPDFQPLPSISGRCGRDGLSGLDERCRFQAGGAINRASVQRQCSFGQGSLLRRDRVQNERQDAGGAKIFLSLAVTAATPAALKTI